jgi:hypothetical protein
MLREEPYGLYQTGDRKSAWRAPLIRDGLGWVNYVKIEMNVETGRLPSDFHHRLQKGAICWNALHANMLKKAHLIGLDIAGSHQHNAFTRNCVNPGMDLANLFQH